jgi:hypothetical protein
LIVYEGLVEVTKNQDPATANPNEMTASESSSAAPATANNGTPTPVPALFKMSINEDGSIEKLQKMTLDELRDSLRNSSDVEIAFHRTPAEISGNVAKFVNFRNISEREEAFRRARALFFWSPADAANLETLGKVYNDWGDKGRPRQQLRCFR